MKKNKIKLLIGITFILILLLVAFLIYRNATKYNGTYTIEVSLVDSESPDRILTVKKDNKKFTDYKYITYDDENQTLLCKSDNSTVNFIDLIGINEVLIKLPNDNIVKAKIIEGSE